MEDVDDADDPLDALLDMGFAVADASAALMEAEGDVHAAINILASPTMAPKEEATKKSKIKKASRKNRATAAPTGTEQPTKSFKEQRKQDLRFKKALRDQKKTCRVCGGAHPRKECPGIADDGRGHSRYTDSRARKESNKNRKQLRMKRQHDLDLLQMGQWTSNCSYWDGFADLVECFRKVRARQDCNDYTIDDLKEWVGAWSDLSIELGDGKVMQRSQQEAKLELQSLSGTKLREKCLKIGGENNQALEKAFSSTNPRRAMIDFIMKSELGDKAAALDIPKRLVSSEWPGYRGCIMPLSVVDPEHIALLDFFSRRPASSSDSTGVVLSVSPQCVSQLLLDVAGREGRDVANAASEDITPLHFSERISECVERIERLVRSYLDSNELASRIVALGCGLDFREIDASKSDSENDLRDGQRMVCAAVLRIAAEFDLPIVVECSDRLGVHHQTSSSDQMYQEGTGKLQSAPSDMVRLLLEYMPPQSGILIRCGSLTVSECPSMGDLLSAFPRLFVGVSIGIMYSKCPMELRNIVFDTPLDRLIVTSEAPHHLPPSLSGASHLFDVPLPPLIALASESVAQVKGVSGLARDIDKEAILRSSTANIESLFHSTSKKKATSA